jgi:hypothetical protein
VEKGAARRGRRANVELFQVDVRTEPRDEVVMLRVSEREMGARRARVIALAENISDCCGLVVVGEGGSGVNLVLRVAMGRGFARKKMINPSVTRHWLGGIKMEYRSSGQNRN